VTAGQGTLSATISFGATFTSGNISVVATNDCGDSPAKTLAVRSTLLAPTTITGSASVCANSTGNIYSCTAVTGATSYLWTVPAGATITSGTGTSSITVNFTTTAGAITVKAVNGCGNSPVKSFTTSMTCMGTDANENRSLTTDSISAPSINVYPNPATEYFNVDITSDMDKDVLLVVYDILGNKIIEQKHTLVNGVNTIKTDFQNYINGVYIVRVIDLNTNTVQTKTFVK
ncbi:MAG: T9SS type A sorting domain-containing protein, partial [Bacteroidia bacterium]